MSNNTLDILLDAQERLVRCEENFNSFKSTFHHQLAKIDQDTSVIDIGIQHGDQLYKDLSVAIKEIRTEIETIKEQMESLNNNKTKQDDNIAKFDEKFTKHQANIIDNQNKIFNRLWYTIVSTVILAIIGGILRELGLIFT